MRRLLAWLLLLAGLLTGLAGAAVLTVLAPPSTITAQTRSSGPAVAVVSAPGVLELSGPTADVRVTGPAGTEVFLAVARADDVDSWLDGAGTTRVTGVAGAPDEARLVTADEGSGAAVDPRGSDVWLASATGDGTAQLVWDTTADDALDGAGGVVLLAATDGDSPAPPDLSISWAAEGAAAEHPSGVPLVVAGCVLAVLGAVGVLVEGRRRHRRPAARPEHRA